MKEHNLDFLEYVAYLPTGLLTQEKNAEKTALA